MLREMPEATEIPIDEEDAEPEVPRARAGVPG
jgi:hypothetical protein